MLYERGDGVPQSLLDAYKWYAIAAAPGDTESKSRIAALQTQLSDQRQGRRQQVGRDLPCRAAEPQRQCAARAGRPGGQLK